MFQVENANFIADKLASELLPRQEFLLASQPILESDAWSMWSKQFCNGMRDAIAQRISEDRAKLEANDPEHDKRIRSRLQDVMKLLRRACDSIRTERRAPAARTSQAPVKRAATVTSNAALEAPAVATGRAREVSAPFAAKNVVLTMQRRSASTQRQS